MADTIYPTPNEALELGALASIADMMQNDKYPAEIIFKSCGIIGNAYENNKGLNFKMGVLVLGALSKAQIEIAEKYRDKVGTLDLKGKEVNDLMAKYLEEPEMRLLAATLKDCDPTQRVEPSKGEVKLWHMATAKPELAAMVKQQVAAIDNKQDREKKYSEFADRMPVDDDEYNQTLSMLFNTHHSRALSMVQGHDTKSNTCSQAGLILQAALDGVDEKKGGIKPTEMMTKLEAAAKDNQEKLAK